MKAMRIPRQSRGVTLIELMISLVIGLVVVGAVMVSFIGSGRAGRYQAALGQMNQDAQVGLNLLAREIQMAGYVSPGNTLGVPAIFACDATKGTVPFTNPTATTANLNCNAWSAPSVSALEVVYEADLATTVPRVVSSVSYPTDCLGDRLPLTGSIYIARNRFYLKPNATTNRNELHCTSNTGFTPQPLIENVDDMQLWFGISVPAASDTVVRFARAGKDASTPDTVNAIGATEWSNVNSVRICLLMRSAEDILTSEDKDTAGNQTYVDCNSNTVPYPVGDLHLRRAYFTTAMVRTKMTLY